MGKEVGGKMGENPNFDFDEAPFCITSLECIRLRILEKNSGKIDLFNLKYEDLILIGKSLDLYATIGGKLERIEELLRGGKDG